VEQVRILALRSDASLGHTYVAVQKSRYGKLRPRAPPSCLVWLPDKSLGEGTSKIPPIFMLSAGNTLALRKNNADLVLRPTIGGVQPAVTWVCKDS
jgi:hypothetical protein